MDQREGEMEGQTLVARVSSSRVCDRLFPLSLPPGSSSGGLEVWQPLADPRKRGWEVCVGGSVRCSSGMLGFLETTWEDLCHSCTHVAQEPQLQTQSAS